MQAQRYSTIYIFTGLEQLSSSLVNFLIKFDHQMDTTQSRRIAISKVKLRIGGNEARDQRNASHMDGPLKNGTGKTTHLQNEGP